MAHNNNDGPIYSMLSGKVFSQWPCNALESNSGPPEFSPGCSGYCDTDVWIGTESEVLAYCDEFAAYYNGGTCLGIVSSPNGDYPNRYLVFVCRPSAP